MKRFLITLLIFGLSIWFGLKIKADPGYFFIHYQNIAIETPLWLGALLLIIALLIAHHLLNLLAACCAMSDKYQAWAQRRCLKKVQQRTNQGLIELTEGHWKKAERYLAESAENNKHALINYLTAAYAAQEQKAYDRRDHYFKLAHQATPNAKVAIGLTQAQLQLRRGQLEQALANLRHLQSLVPNHGYVLKLLSKVYIKLNDWDSLLELMPLLQRRAIMNPQAFQSLEQRVYCAQIKKHMASIEALKNVWDNGIPKKLKSNPELFMLYVESVIQQGETSLAEQMLKQFLKQHWHQEAVECYGLLEANANEQLSYAESWLKSYPHDPALLLCLGQLAFRCQFWGKAKTYLEKSIALQKSEHSKKARALFELGKVYEQLQDREAAFSAYQRAAKHFCHST